MGGGSKGLEGVQGGGDDGGEGVSVYMEGGFGRGESIFLSTVSL